MILDTFDEFNFMVILLFLFFILMSFIVIIIINAKQRNKNEESMSKYNKSPETTQIQCNKNDDKC